MESRGITPGPYRATKLWNEVTTCFRAGMPLRKHRQHFKKHGNCFTACEAVDWLYELLRSNSNFGPEVTRQQTVQLLRKFLKNHVIEDIKGRWGSESLDDNGQLFRFPTTSPLKTVPRRHPELRKSSLENVSKEKENGFKFRPLARRTPKKLELTQENAENMKNEILDENKENPVEKREISQEDVEEIWRHTILMHLQAILGISSLEEILDTTQILPQHIIYNMTNTSKHGVVVLQNKADDLPHWVLSAMKCLANWPRSNDLSQPTYVGFERDVFRTVADYFLDLPEPLLTFGYYELFVNILVVCGYITVPHRTRREPPRGGGPPGTGLSSFKSTECLLLSLLHKDKQKEESEPPEALPRGRRRLPGGSPGELPPGHPRSRRSRASGLLGGSCQNLAGLKEEAGPAFSRLRPRCCSLEGLVEASQARSGRKGEELWEPREAPGTAPGPKGGSPTARSVGCKRTCPAAVGAQEEACPGKLPPKQLCRSQSLLFGRPGRRSCRLGRSTGNVAAAAEAQDDGTTAEKRLCRSSLELSRRASPPLSSGPPPTQSLLQPHLERVAIDALQICCLLLPPANRRRLQLLLRMASRMSQNVDLPRLHDALGTRSLMIQTFSRCVLRCAQEADLDELLAARLVSFLMDHQQEVLQVPTHLEAAVEKHLERLRKGQVLNSSREPLPEYSYCRRISAREFDEQKVATSQAAIAELLESIIRDRSLALRDKRKKLKQFQKEYPAIYQSRFPTTESEAALLGDKPTLKQPMLLLRKPKFRSLRY